MHTPTDDIPLSGLTGKERWNRSVQIERLMLNLRDIACRATYRSNSPLATPAEFEAWSKDLRKGRMSIIGSFKRFVDLIEQRRLGAQGRQLAEEAWSVAYEYMDMLLPADAPKAEAKNTVDVDISSETRRVRLANYGKALDRVTSRSA